MADGPQYKRVLIKVSGESFCSPGGAGIDSHAVAGLVDLLRGAVDLGVQIALVVGGGNILRGRDLAQQPHVARTTADYMGMLATVINALALRDALEAQNIPARTMSAIAMTTVCEPFVCRQAIRHLEQGRVVILAGGTGSPFFTTDTCAALRASELGAEVLFKATKVDGVFDSDPIENPAAKKYDKLTYDKVLADRLGVMDLTPISLCMANKIPIIVFELSRPGNLVGAVCGRKVGTIVSE